MTASEEPAASDLVIPVDAFGTHAITWDRSAGRGRCSCGNWAAFDVSFFEFRGAARRHLVAEREKASRARDRPAHVPSHRPRSRGEDLVDQHGSVRAARRATHPDSGGSSEDFIAVQAYANRTGRS